MTYGRHLTDPIKDKKKNLLGKDKTGAILPSIDAPSPYGASLLGNKTLGESMGLKAPETLSNNAQNPYDGVKSFEQYMASKMSGTSTGTGGASSGAITIKKTVDNFTTPILSGNEGSEPNIPTTETETATEIPKTTGEMEKWILSQLEKEKALALENAEKTYESDYIDAERKYAQSRADYGAQAEALRDVGLDTSGYANYLNDRAYAEMIADQQKAKLVRDENQRKAESDYNSQYMDFMLNRMTQKASTSAEISKKYEAGVSAGNFESLIGDKDNMTETDFDLKMQDLSAEISNGSFFTDKTTGTLVLSEKAKEAIKAIKEYYGSDSLEAKAAEKNYDKLYRVYVDKDFAGSGHHGNPDSYYLGIAPDEFDDTEEDGIVKVWHGGKSFEVVKGAQITDSTNPVLAAAESMGFDPSYATVFGFNDSLYVARSGKVWKIEEKNGSGYNKLYDFVFGSNETTAREQGEKAPVN